MQKIANIINKLDFDTVLFYGVGSPFLLFDKIKGKKLGIDKYDVTQYPRQWSTRTVRSDIQSRGTKKKFDLVVINNSRRYKDVSADFNKALKNLNEGGSIILIDSMPKTPQDITDTPFDHQSWCGEVYQFVLELVSKGGFKVSSNDEGNGFTIVKPDDSIPSTEIFVSGFEEWYFERKKIMNN